MKNVFNALLFSLLSLFMLTAHATDANHAVSARGEVKIIDMASKKITIAHQPIPALNWPAMTMRFTLAPDTQLNDVKPGDNVDFTFIQQGNLSLLQDIHLQ